MILDLIDNNKIEIFLQPIVSIKDKKVYAFEALTRAYDHYGEIISPLYLFEQARKEALSCKLDCHVRSLALEKFKTYYEKDPSLLLFLNFESSIIDHDLQDDFTMKVNELEINPSSIVVEIKEDSVKDNGALKNFVKRNREFGFIIAIDDFGTGYSSFDRLSLIQPDIVKVDRSLIYNVHNNFINSEVLSAISNMCHKIGAMVLAEGVEDNEEILKILKKDIDLFQGFYFAYPNKQINETDNINILEKINTIGDSYTQEIKTIMHKKEMLIESSKTFTKKVINILKKSSVNYKYRIEKILQSDERLEAVYLLDGFGKQIGQTIIKSSFNSLYSPTSDGHDHSLKEYFFVTKESKKSSYLSDRYVSKASGHMCRTYSTKVSINGYDYIVCFDILD